MNFKACLPVHSLFCLVAIVTAASPSQAWAKSMSDDQKEQHNTAITLPINAPTAIPGKPLLLVNTPTNTSNNASFQELYQPKLVNLAQVLPPPQDIIPPLPPDRPETDFIPDSTSPLPPEPSNEDPRDRLLEDLSDFPESFAIRNISFEGNTAFSKEQLFDALVEKIEEIKSIEELFTENANVTDLLRIVTAINQYYADEGYLTTGALLPIPPEEGFPEGMVTITIVEGGVESIEVMGTQRLQAEYVRSRLALGTGRPLRQQEILDALQLLQEDPLIESIQATLTAGTDLGSNILQVKIQEARSFQVEAFADNNRTPNVGTVQTGISISEGNLTSRGDSLSLSYNLTAGSDGVTVGYRLPVNAREGSLSLNYSYGNSRIIESSVDELGIRSNSQYWDLTYRQPLIRTPRQEFALGLTGSYRDSQAVFGEDILGEAIPFQTPGSDEDGRSRLTVIRFFQDWTSRSRTEAYALRSQLSLGIEALGATINSDSPDGRFFSWRGQAQWRRRLWKDAFVLIGADMQLADRPLLPVEQFTLGGLSTVRGYRQNLLLADNGIAGTAELWMPIMRVPEVEGILHIVPFMDAGTVWNSGGFANPDPNALVSTGLGLRWQQENLSFRLDWGIPLTSVDQGDSLQENGIYLSLRVNRL